MPFLDSPESLCLCGIARADITPPVGIYHRMWGAAMHDRSTGVHRPLTATALVLQAAPEAKSASVDAVHELALVAVDHCLLGGGEMQTLLSRVSSATGLAREQLLVLFSHTHAAGLMGLERAELPGGDLIEPYLELLAQRLAGIIRQARGQLEPAAISYARGSCTLAANRDYWDAENRQWVCGLNPEGPADDTIVVARLADFHGRTLGVIVNYACHPTTLAWDNTLISPDYPGAARQVIEEATGAPAFFIQGASGDLGPREGYVGDVAVADSNGRQLGYAALSALESLGPPCTRLEYRGPVVSGAVIGTWSRVALGPGELARKGTWRHRHWTADLPYRPDLPDMGQLAEEYRRQLEAERVAREAGDAALARDCRALAEVARRKMARLSFLPPGPSYAFPIHLWQMGDAFWVAVEGEHYQWLQTSLRARFPRSVLIVATLANGSVPSYLPPASIYGSGIYQESIALLAPGCLERVEQEIAQQIDGWVSK